MTQFRTSSLFHYTSFNTLKKILEEGIFPNFCREDLSHDTIARWEFILGIPMVSFCDIPLTRTNDFRSRYGNHAIGLNKQWAVSQGINPIFYIHNKHILYFLHDVRLSTESMGIKLNGSWYQHCTPFSPPINIQAKHTVNQNLYGYVKKYTGKNPKTGKDQCNYEENEWRYIVHERKDIDWLWGQKEYEQWRGINDKPEATEALKNQKLTFTVEDISHIIVDKDSQIPAIITYIRKLTKLGGMENILTSDEKDMLCAKVTSIERIEKDY